MAFNPTWLILFLPLISAALISCVTVKCGRLSSMISVFSAGVCALLAGGLVSGHLTPPEPFMWLNVGGLEVTIGFWMAGTEQIPLLAKVMLLVVTVIGFLIHFYSIGYMKGEEGKGRYFAGLSLFMFSMTGIVVADNLVMMYIFWELVGFSSYYLIGHYFNRPSAGDAAKKAFLTNKIGDFGFIIGIIMAYDIYGTVSLEALMAQQSVVSDPSFVVMTLCLICGAIGKSAQFPLHVWLPDAMEGPTPVSALMHAATMVAAGVYMLCRIFFLIVDAGITPLVVAWAGAITCLLAALIAVQQNDIKRILAYSTLSQLGYMFMAVGLCAPNDAMFHLATHACFKALLFLGAGSVIVALHHEQDIWRMGGLWKKMPVTFWTFAAGAYALSALPLSSGFFSKDLILVAAFEQNKAIWLVGSLVAFLTPFYVTRLLVVAFLNKPADPAGPSSHAHESPWVMTLPLVILAVPSLIGGIGLIPDALNIPHEDHNWTVSGIATGAALLGVISSWMLYRGRRSDPLHIRPLANRLYFDEMYLFFIRGVQQTFAQVLGLVDRWIIDGLVVNGTGLATSLLGRGLSLMQTGNVQTYVLILVVGILAVLTVVFGLGPRIDMVSSLFGNFKG